MTLTVLRPTAISDANLVSSTVAEPAAGETEYNPATEYSDGNQVIVTATHRIYELLPGAGPVTDVYPPDNPTQWADAGPTVRYAAFDESIGSVTKGPSPMVFEFTGSFVAGMAFQQLKCSTVRIQAASVEYGEYFDKTFTMQDRAVVDDWWDFIFKPLFLQSQLNVLDMTPLPESTYTVTIASEGDATDVEVGVFVMGEYSEYGGVELSPTAGIVNYGKTTERFGITTLQKGKYARRLAMNVRVKNQIIDAVQTELEMLRDTLAMYIGSSDGLELLNIYGFYETFETTVKYQTVSLVSLRVRSLS